MIKTTFIDLLNDLSKYGNRNILYTKGSSIDLCDEVIIDDDIYDIKNNINGYEYFCGMDQFKSIVRNFDMQKPNNTDLNLYIKAINYYIENDAFIDLEHNTKE